MRTVELRLGSLVAVGALIMAVAPLLFWSGIMWQRVAKLESYTEAHELEVKAKTDMLIRNDEQLRQLADGQRRFLLIMEDVNHRLMALEQR